LLDQLLGYFRDLMVALAGCPPGALLYSSPGEHAELLALGRQLGLNTIMAMMQIIEQTVARLRYSMHARALAELALVRISMIADLESIPALLADLRNENGSSASTNVRTANARGASPPTAPPSPTTIKKKSDGPTNGDVNQSLSSPQPASLTAHGAGNSFGRTAPPDRATSEPLTSDRLATAWQSALESVGGLLADSAQSATLAPDGNPPPGGRANVVATFAAQYNFGKQFCERADHLRRLEQALGEALDREVRLTLKTSTSPESADPQPAEKPKTAPPRQRMSRQMEHPWVKRATELFDARVVWMEEPQS
jgi:DNA polymerase-3 subunit gamma/tau